MPARGGSPPADFDEQVSTRIMMKKIPATPVLTWLILAALLVSTAAGINFIRTAHVQSFDASSPIKEEFVGDKIAPEMREAGSTGRVSAILQANDVNRLLARNGILLGDSMAKLGAMKVDLPAHVIESLMQNESMNFYTV